MDTVRGPVLVRVGSGDIAVVGGRVLLGAVGELALGVGGGVRELGLA